LGVLPSPSEALMTVTAEKDRRRALASLAEFLRQGWHVLEPGAPLEPNWHINVVCDHIQALFEDWERTQLAARGEVSEVDLLALYEAERLGMLTGESRPSRAGPRLYAVHRQVTQRFRNLLVSVPPGTAKSRIVSVYFPAWAWLHWPSWRAVFLSVNPKVALRDSVFCRDVLRSRWYQSTFQPPWEFAEDQDAKGLYKNTAGGSRMAMGYFAQMVGDRGDALLVDDPNDPDEVHSQNARESVNERWEATLQNRVNDLRNSTRCLIQQRVHEDDLSGFVLAEQPKLWEHLRIAMERDDGKGCACPTCVRGHTALGWRDPRAPGELMFPQRFPEEVLAPFRAKEYLWTSQYQQRPVPAAGNLFKDESWRFWRRASEPEIPKFAHRTVIVPDSFDREALSVDCSFKQTKDSDLVASGVWGQKGPNFYLLELAWERMGIQKTMDTIEAQTRAHPRATLKLVEDKANGSAVIELLGAKISGLVAENPTESKEGRAVATSVLVEAGNVFLPLHAPWRDKYISEHSAFPKGVHDDAVDQQSQLLLRWGIGSTPKHTQQPGRYGGRRL
jgi:predicted phage terminase large subunit-like protein